MSKQAKRHMGQKVYSTEGVDSINVDTAGNVGIGTTSPLNPAAGRGNITLNGTSSAILYLSVAGVSRGYFYADATHTELDSPGYLQFNTNGAERMRIDTSGALVVGTTASGNTVHGMYGRNAAGDADAHGFSLRAPGSGSRQYIGFLTDDTNGWSGFKATKDGGGSGLTIRLYAGSTYSTFSQGGSSWTFVSDRNAKENIEDLNYGLKEVLNLKPVRFSYKGSEEEKGNNLGFIAQDVQTVLPELVKTMPEGTLALAQTEIIAVLTKAIQEQQEIISKQASAIEKLEARLAALEAK